MDVYKSINKYALPCLNALTNAEFDSLLYTLHQLMGKLVYCLYEEFSSLLEFHPDIDRLISIPSKMNFRELWSFGGYLKRNGYDLIYDLHNSLRSNIVTFQSRSHVFQLQKPRWKRMMLFYFHENYFDPQFSTRSMYHEYLGSIWNGDHSSIPSTSLRLSDGKLKRGKRLISDLGIHGNYIAIVPGAAWNQKQWPASKYIELLNKIDVPSILIGSSKDKICQEIHRGLNNSLDLLLKAFNDWYLIQELMSGILTLKKMQI